VRYRDDEKTARRYTTVELIVAEEVWQAPVIVKPDDLVFVKIASDEKELWQKIKDAGAKWSKTRKMWKLPYKIACEMKLAKRIVVEDEKYDAGKENGEKLRQKAKGRREK
jgi:hypothetical protein